MIVVALLSLVLLILFHELGHFAAAKLFYIQVNEFSLGMGPSLWSKQGKETKYSLRLLPVGGYVSIEGEGLDSDNPRGLNHAPKWQKCIIMLAGIAVNLLIGYLLTFALVLPNNTFAEPVVTTISPAAASVSGLQPGDRILSMGNFHIFNAGDIDSAEAFSGKEFQITVSRDSKRVVLENKHTWDEKGVSYIDNDIAFQYREGNFPYKIGYAFNACCSLGQSVLVGLRLMLTGKVSINDVSGPVGIVSTIAASPDIGSFLYLIAFISINLGIMNLIPLPALDGGQVMVTIFEGISKKTLNRKVLAYVNVITLGALLLCIAVISVFDFIKIF